MNFENFYNEHKNRVYNLALHYTLNEEDAQEITQDVFVAAYHNLDKFEGNALVSTWLYRITVNKCLDFLKSAQRKKRFAWLNLLSMDGNEVSQNMKETRHPGIQMEQKEALENLLQAIRQLPENQMTVLILHKIEQKSQKEVAEIMKISSKAVESLVQRAKTNLAKKIK